MVHFGLLDYNCPIWLIYKYVVRVHSRNFGVNIFIWWCEIHISGVAEIVSLKLVLKLEFNLCSRSFYVDLEAFFSVLPNERNIYLRVVLRNKVEPFLEISMFDERNFRLEQLFLILMEICGCLVKIGEFRVDHVFQNLFGVKDDSLSRFLSLDISVYGSHHP